MHFGATDEDGALFAEEEGHEQRAPDSNGGGYQWLCVVGRRALLLGRNVGAKVESMFPLLRLLTMWVMEQRVISRTG